MKNILLISTIYPRPEGNIGTHVCHYFTREWIKMGYNVRVVHIQAVYPRFFYWFAKLAQKKIAAKTSAVIYTQREKKIAHYKMDNVPICRIPVFKPIPHGAFSRYSIKNALKTIVDDNKSVGFAPDVIIGHFPNPQLELLYELKHFYPNTKTCEVLHLPEEINQLKSVYGKNLALYMDSVDIWGFRFKYLRELFSKKYEQPIQSFICYSGIPESYLIRDSRVVRDKVSEFVFVGEMIERKYPTKVLDALLHVYPNKDFHVNFIGDGDLKQSIQERVKREKLNGSVSVLGRIPRDNIKEKYDNADCFIMISKGEAYGLVYLEAMARGCITIASRNEGFDGVIVDGENGFLCKAGDIDELTSIVKHINTLTYAERQKISDNAIATARRLTDFKAAKMYIEDVKNGILVNK